MNENKPVKHGALWTVLFAVVSLFWIFPIVLVLINSFKQKAYISKNAFSLPAGKAFVGLENYVRGIETTQFFASFGWTLLITVGSVALILVCTSMCAWWIVRVNNWAAKLLYTLFLFNMIVPFQMVMFTLSKIADMLKLNTPWGLCIVYLGFGAGLAVFIFTGVIKGIPQELEESAMIDGASVPRIFFQIVVPIMKPSIVSVAILEAMWIWNDYLLPYLTLDLGKYKTVSVAVQYLKGVHRKVRSGFAEVIYCAGKADEHLLHIFERLYKADGQVFGTRATQHQYEILREKYPQVEYDPISHIIKIEKKDKEHIGNIAVCTAGTADIAVAEEAAQTAEYFGTKVTRVYDVGVSGIHRLLGNLEAIQSANCVVAVAGMEGALASVLGGLVDKPVSAYFLRGSRMSGRRI